jgi:hypothetical protein
MSGFTNEAGGALSKMTRGTHPNPHSDDYPLCAPRLPESINYYFCLEKYEPPYLREFK